MHKGKLKSIGGLSPQYYFRQLVFSSVIAGFLVYAQVSSGKAMRLDGITIIAANTFLYPFSRFVYESIIDFLFGNFTISANLWLVLFVKYITVMLCWVFAIFVAPFGLLYLHLRQRNHRGG